MSFLKKLFGFSDHEDGSNHVWGESTKGRHIFMFPIWFGVHIEFKDCFKNKYCGVCSKTESVWTTKEVRLVNKDEAE